MGERKPMTVKVDEDVKDDWEDFVVDTKGQKYGNMGRLLERAMREYMDRDRLARVESELAEIRSLVESQKEGDEKHPGNSVRKREDAAIKLIVTPDRKQVHRNELEEAIRAQNLTSKQTIKKYMKSITSRPVFKSGPSPSLWEVDHDHAEDYY